MTQICLNRLLAHSYVCIVFRLQFAVASFEVIALPSHLVSVSDKCSSSVLFNKHNSARCSSLRCHISVSDLITLHHQGLVVVNESEENLIKQ